jgi:cellulose synthase/poly-beta-1,6-N-acetylglucosamine synthase-like glycosyltransferase
MLLCAEVCFWLLAAGVLYTYAGYPLLLAVAAKLRPRPVRRGPGHPRSVSVVVAVRNEEAAIDRRLHELTAQLQAAGAEGEIIVVSDGSTDGTAAVARAHTKGPVRVLELPRWEGKAAALSAGCAAATGEVLVFADARQTWAAEALGRLLENFADPEVGAVSGNLMVTAAPGVMAGVSLYWRFEKWLRRKESEAGSMVGATGAISAVRRELFRPVPAGTVLDDVYWPLGVAMRGRRVVLDTRAVAYDCLPVRARDELRRKVRTLSGNLQLLARLPGAALPWRNPLWFRFVSHKLLRMAVPWALLALLVLSALLPAPLYRALFWVQAEGYLLAVLGACTGIGARLRFAAAAGSFLVLNVAAWLAFWVWASGRSGSSWARVVYAPPAAANGVAAIAPADCPGDEMVGAA